VSLLVIVSLVCVFACEFACDCEFCLCVCL